MGIDKAWKNYTPTSIDHCRLGIDQWFDLGCGSGFFNQSVANE